MLQIVVLDLVVVNTVVSVQRPRAARAYLVVSKHMPNGQECLR